MTRRRLKVTVVLTTPCSVRALKCSIKGFLSLAGTGTDQTEEVHSVKVEPVRRKRRVK